MKISRLPVKAALKVIDRVNVSVVPTFVTELPVGPAIVTRLNKTIHMVPVALAGVKCVKDGKKDRSIRRVAGYRQHVRLPVARARVRPAKGFKTAGDKRSHQARPMPIDGSQRRIDQLSSRSGNAWGYDANDRAKVFRSRRYPRRGHSEERYGHQNDNKLSRSRAPPSAAHRFVPYFRSFRFRLHFVDLPWRYAGQITGSLVAKRL